MSISRTPITSRYIFIRLIGASVDPRNFGAKDYLLSVSTSTQILIESDLILAPLNFCDVKKRYTMPCVGPVNLRHPAHDSRGLVYGTRWSYGRLTGISYTGLGWRFNFNVGYLNTSPRCNVWICESVICTNQCRAIQVFRSYTINPVK